MKILITGNRGYLGTELTKHLNGLGHEVIGFDLKEGRDIRIVKHFDWIESDVDMCVHLAGIVGDPNCDKDINNAYETNVDGSRNVINYCKENNIPMIFASSCSVYGFIEGEELQNEEDRVNPVSFYAFSKVSTEHDIKKDLKKFTILRFGTLFGWSSCMRYDLVANFVIKRAFEKGKITIFGGEQIRPFVHVQDVCKAIEIAINEQQTGETYNVVSFNITLKRLGETISEATGCELFVDTSIVDKRSYNADGRKLYDKGFTPDYNIYDCIHEVKTNEIDKV